jgi:hypothetical protein
MRLLAHLRKHGRSVVWDRSFAASSMNTLAKRGPTRREMFSKQRDSLMFSEEEMN